MRSCTSMKYIFNSFLLSELLLNKKLLNIYLIKVDERDTNLWQNGRVYPEHAVFTFCNNNMTTHSIFSSAEDVSLLL